MSLEYHVTVLIFLIFRRFSIKNFERYGENGNSLASTIFVYLLKLFEKAIVFIVLSGNARVIGIQGEKALLFKNPFHIEGARVHALFFK